MNMFDIIILCLLGFGLIKGWMSGLFKQAVSLGGFFVGLAIAYALYAKFGTYLAPKLGTSESMAQIAAFFILWIAVPIGLGLVATLLTKAVESVHLGPLNSLGGALLGMLKYAILISCALNVMSFTHMVSEEKQQESIFFAPVKSVLSVLYHSFDTKKAADDSQPQQQQAE